MGSSFAEIMFDHHGCKNRAKKYPQIKQNHIDHNSIDAILGDFDQEQSGDAAILHNFALFRDASRFKEEYAFFNKPFVSPIMNFFAQLEENDNPKSFGLLHRRNPQVIKIRSFYIPKEYVSPLASSLYLAGNLLKVDLSRTQLSDSSGAEIVRNIPTQLSELSLSHNQDLGTQFLTTLSEEVLSDVRFKLETLNLEDCNLGNESVIKISESFKNNIYLRVLNLSKNGITREGIEQFSNELSGSFLRVLQLHWNPLGPYGGKALVEALAHNSNLRVLDVSWCNLGRCINKIETDELDEEQRQIKLISEFTDSSIPLNPAEKRERDRRVKQELKKLKIIQDNY